MYIPESVESNYNLSPNEKYLYGLILKNTDANLICTKSNIFFASFFGNNLGVSDRTIRRYLKKLKDERLIGFVNLDKIKNAIFVANPDHIKELNSIQNLKKNSVQADIVSVLDKFVQVLDKSQQNNDNSNPIISTLNDLFNIVLGSQENKNNINNNARTRSTVNNLNTFANYEEAGKTERVKHFDFETRKPFTHVLFKEFFDYHPGGKFFETGKEVVDVMISAYEQSKTQSGLKFAQKTWHADDLLDVFYNITSDEFSSIVNSATLRDDIHSRNCYILGSIINAGTLVDWKKTSKLVSQGYPWDNFVPGQKPLRDVVIRTQQRICRENQNKQFAKEFAGVIPAMN